MFGTSLALAVTGLLAAPAFAGELTVGDQAPALEVQWVKGEPVASFAPGGVYVVEFWATWCGPCKVSIPHLSALQAEYGDKATFIGVSVWEDDQSLVTPFVEKMGEQMGYRVAMDVLEEDRGKMAQGWMKAAQLDGIPSAFIVEGNGRIAWIGHPAEIDQPLSKVVSGEWDVDAFAATYKLEREKGAKMRALQERAYAAANEGNWKEAIVALDEIIKVDPAMEGNVGPMKFQGLLSLGNFEKAYAYGATLVDGACKRSPSALNAIAWTIVDPEAKDLERRDLELALRAANLANELTESKEPSILDTLAKVHFDMGEMERAIEIQTKAVELSKGTDWEQELTRRLDEYKGAAKS